MDYSPPGSSVQVMMLEWVPISPPGDLPDPGIKPMSPAPPALAVDASPLSHLAILLASHQIPGGGGGNCRWVDKLDRSVGTRGLLLVKGV